MEDRTPYITNRDQDTAQQATDWLEAAIQTLKGTDEDDPRQDHVFRVRWAQVTALVAIAQELRRFNDRAEANEERLELSDAVRIWGA